MHIAGVIIPELLTTKVATSGWISPDKLTRMLRAKHRTRPESRRSGMVESEAGRGGGQHGRGDVLRIAISAAV